MILDLTIENYTLLEKSDFESKDIYNILKNQGNYNLNYSESRFHIDHKQKKIHTDIDCCKFLMQLEDRDHFPIDYLSLIPEYYEITLKKYLKTKQEEGFNNLITKSKQTQLFIKTQIKKFEQFNKYDQVYLDKYGTEHFGMKAINIEKREAYLIYLETKLGELDNPRHEEPQQKEDIQPNLHNNIFKGNTFDLWELYRTNKNITASSQTDLSVIFQLMMLDSYFQETVELKHFINWINGEYFEGTITTLRKQNLKSNPNIQRTNDYKQYKSNLNITLK